MTNKTINFTQITLLASSILFGFDTTPNWIFAPLTPYPGELCIFTDIAPWDFDQDGCVELAACSYSYDPVNPLGGEIFLLHLVSDNLVQEWVGNLMAGYQCLLWADIDGDADDDLVAGTSILHPSESHSSIVYFENVEGVLSASFSNLSITDNWDVMDLTLGDFNFDGYPDILVTRACGPFRVLAGQQTPFTTQGWTLLPVIEEDLQFQSYRGDGSGLRTSVWDVNGDGYLDIARGNPNAASEIRTSDDNSGCYEIDVEVRRACESWFSISYSPPQEVASDDGMASIITGNAWKAGACCVWNRELGESSLIEQNGHEYFAEFVSDLAFVSVGPSSDTYLALSEAGLLIAEDISDPRHRCGRVLEIDKSSSGWEAAVYWSEPEPPSSRRPEAFRVTWCDMEQDTPATMELTFSGGGRLFFIGDAEGLEDFDCFRPIYRIIACYGEDSHGNEYPVHSWFIENGWLGTLENIPSSDQLFLSVLTSNSPDLFYARRGCVEGYQW